MEFQLDNGLSAYILPTRVYAHMTGVNVFSIYRGGYIDFEK